MESRPSYRNIQSDYYTHVMDIPPQYGPGFSDNNDATAEAQRVVTAALALDIREGSAAASTPGVSAAAASPVAAGSAEACNYLYSTSVLSCIFGVLLLSDRRVISVGYSITLRQSQKSEER